MAQTRKLAEENRAAERTVYIQKRSKRTYALWVVLALVGLTVLGALFFAGRQAIYARTHEDTADATIETNIFQVGSQIPGTVSEVLVEENQAVKKGQVLARLDGGDVSLREKQAAAALDLTRKQAEAATMQIAQLKEAMAKGAVSPDAKKAQDAQLKQVEAAAAQQTAQLKQAQAAASQQLTRAQQRLAQVNGDYKQMMPAVQEGAVAPMAVHQAEMTLEMAKMQHDQAAANLQGLKAKQAQLQQALKQAKQQVGGSARPAVDKAALAKQLKAAEMQYSQLLAAGHQAELGLEAARSAAKDTQITSPIDGVVAKKMLSPGMQLQPGQPVVAIVQQGPIWVTANFNEKQIGRIQPGQRAVIRVANDPNAVVVGRVATIAPAAFLKAAPQQPQQAPQQSGGKASSNTKKASDVRPVPQIVRNVPVRIDFDPAKNGSRSRILPGMSAYVSVEVQ